MWTPVSYTYYFKGKQKKLEQTTRRGRRLSILGLWQPSVTPFPPKDQVGNEKMKLSVF
jgi:hypothetical protein